MLTLFLVYTPRLDFAILAVCGLDMRTDDQSKHLVIPEPSASS